METVIFGFVGCMGIGGVAYLITTLFGNRRNILKQGYDKLQNLLIKKVEHIEETQGKLKVQIDNKEELSKKSKERIKKIIKKSSNDIQEILKEDNIQKIQDQVDKEWRNL